MNQTDTYREEVQENRDLAAKTGHVTTILFFSETRLTRPMNRFLRDRPKYCSVFCFNFFFLLFTLFESNNQRILVYCQYPILPFTHIKGFPSH